jgi:hypothetical protein
VKTAVTGVSARRHTARGARAFVEQQHREADQRDREHDARRSVQRRPDQSIAAD